MRSSIERYNIWTQSENRINFNKADGLKIINTLCTTSTLRAGLAYNGCGHEVAARVCEKVSGQTWDEVLHERIVRPLGLDRTDASDAREEFGNVARTYMVLDDMNPVKVPAASMSGKTLLGGAGGVVSCVADLLVLYQHLLASGSYKFANDTTSAPDKIFKQLSITMAALPTASAEYRTPCPARSHQSA
jgi:CubicO group peptidase (beta-lactamase class C family)